MIWSSGSRVMCLSLAGLLVTGCSPGSLFSAAPTAQLFDRQGIDLVSEPSERRTTFFKDDSSRERFCRAPGPDFAVTASQGISIGFGLPGGGSKGVSDDAGEGALGLGGRNPEVLLAREMLYRACELSLNINADAKTTREIYDRFLKSIETLSSSQTGVGSASAAAAAPNVQAPAANLGSGTSSSGGTGGSGSGSGSGSGTGGGDSGGDDSGGSGGGG